MSGETTDGDVPAVHINVIGNIGSGNVGDEAMLRAVLDHCISPKWRVTVHRSRRADWLDPRPANQHVAYVKRFTLTSILSLIQGPVLLCGGTSFHTYFTGCRRLRQYVAMGLVLVQLAATRVSRNRVGAFGIGFGQLDSALSRIMVRILVRICEVIIVRSPHDRRRIEAACGTLAVTGPDLSWLSARGRAGDASARSSERHALAIVPTTQVVTRQPVPSVEQIRKLARQLAVEHVTLLPFSQGGPDDDLAVCEEIAEELQGETWGVSILRNDELAERVHRCSIFTDRHYVMSARFHGTLLALQAGCKVWPCSYSPKTEDLVDELSGWRDSGGGYHVPPGDAARMRNSAEIYRRALYKLVHVDER